MTTFQKIIKNVATAFAWFLVVVCISSCFVGLYYFGALLGFDITEENKDCYHYLELFKYTLL